MIQHGLHLVQNVQMINLPSLFIINLYQLQRHQTSNIKEALKMPSPYIFKGLFSKILEIASMSKTTVINKEWH
jgi:hypothetical protein